MDFRLIYCSHFAMPHTGSMAALSSISTDAQVFASYDDNASYEEDGDRAKAKAFITACRLLRRRRPTFAGRDGQQVTLESLEKEITAAQQWLEINPVAGSAGSRTRYFSMRNFRG